MWIMSEDVMLTFVIVKGHPQIKYSYCVSQYYVHSCEGKAALVPYIGTVYFQHVG